MRLRTAYGSGIMGPRRARCQAAAFADTFNAAEVMAMRPGDRNARQVQQALADGAALDDPGKHIAFLRSPGAPGGARPMISFNDEGDQEPWKTDQSAREDDTQTVTSGAGKLPVTPMAWLARTGGSHAL
jgi:hypothetical protein